MGMERPPAQRSCSACGHAPAQWLITARYIPGPRSTEIGGRLLVYCEACRYRFDGHRVGVSIPLSVLDADPDRILTALYECGATESEPDTTAEVIDVPPGRWVPRARAMLGRQGKR